MGYTRIQGPLTVVGHRVGRTTIARLLRAHGLPPVPERPTSWQICLRAHWGAIAGVRLSRTRLLPRMVRVIQPEPPACERYAHGEEESGRATG